MRSPRRETPSCSTMNWNSERCALHRCELVTIDRALDRAIRLLRGQRVAVPELTARVFLADVLGRDQCWLIAHSREELSSQDHVRYMDMLRARANGVPTQYIRGVQEFFGLELHVDPHVLIPRPETEHLVEAALERLRPGDRVLDIGTGSGGIAVALARHARDAFVAAIDISAAAARVAHANAVNLDADVHCLVGDLGEPVTSQAFEMVVSNPPYVPLRNISSLQRELRHEPSIALYGGEDGLDVVRQLIPTAARILKPGGWLLFEIALDFRPTVAQLLHCDQWSDPQFLPDLAGIDRVVAVRRSGTPHPEEFGSRRPQARPTI